MYDFLTTIYWTTQSKAIQERDDWVQDSTGSRGGSTSMSLCRWRPEENTSALADVSLCIIFVIIVVVLHGLFPTSNVLKLARFRVPHTLDLHLEFCHLDAEEFLRSQFEEVRQMQHSAGCQFKMVCSHSRTHQNTSLLRSKHISFLTDRMLLQQCHHSFWTAHDRKWDSTSNWIFF